MVDYRGWIFYAEKIKDRHSIPGVGVCIPYSAVLSFKLLWLL